MPSAAAEGVDDLDPVAVRQPVFGMAPTRNDLAVHFHRHPTLGQALGNQQLGEGAGGGKGEWLAVESDIHPRLSPGAPGLPSAMAGIPH